MKLTKRRQRLDLIFFVNSAQLQERILQVCFFFKLAHQKFESFEQYKQQSFGYSRPQVIVFDNEALIAQLEKNFPRGLLIFICADNATEEVSHRVLKLNMGEALEGSKLDFLVGQATKGSYVPIPKNDLFPETVVPFTAFLKLPLNQKYLPVVFRNLKLPDKKFSKIPDGHVLYVRHHEVVHYYEYISKYNDRMGAGLKKRLRAVLSLLDVQILQVYMGLGGIKDKNFDVEKELMRLQATATEFLSYMDEEGFDIFGSLKGLMNDEYDAYFGMGWCLILVLFFSKKFGFDSHECLRLALFSQLGFLSFNGVNRFDLNKMGRSPSAKLSQEHSKLHGSNLRELQKFNFQIDDKFKEKMLMVWSAFDSEAQLKQLKKEDHLEANLVEVMILLWRWQSELIAAGKSVETSFLLKELVRDELGLPTVLGKSLLVKFADFLGLK